MSDREERLSAMVLRLVRLVRASVIDQRDCSQYEDTEAAIPAALDLMEEMRRG